MDEAKANISVNNEEDKKEENDDDPINRDSDTSGPQHFLLPSPFTRSQKQFQNYVHKPGISKYDVALKHLIPIRPKDSNSDKIMPADSAGLFSHIYVQWMTPYLWKAYKSGITIADLPPISPYDSANYNVQRLEALWQEELSRHGPTSASLKKIAWRFVRTRIFVSCFVLTCSIILGFLSPAILMKKILEHVQSTEGTIWDGLKWVALLTLTDFLRTTFFAWTWVTNYRTAIRLKSACTTMLYRKIIRLNSLGSKNMGELINLFSNDSQRLFDVIVYGPMIISGPIATTCGILYILWIFNPIALLGIIVFLLFYPCQYLISRITGYFRARTVAVTDKRVRLINEILECIKLIKMYSWENHFRKRLLDIRKKEQSLVRRTAYFQSLSICLTPAVPVISAIITFLAQVSSGHNLKASEAFPITTLFRNSLRLALASLKDSTRYIVDVLVAFRRIKVFPLVSLLNTQIRSFLMFIQVALVNIAESKIALNRLKSVVLLEETNCHISKPIVRSQAISIFNASFLCDGLVSPEDTSKVPNDKRRKHAYPNDKQNSELEKLNRSSEGAKYVEVLTDINFDIAKGALIGICGPVGSGKSSLLLAALGQLRMAKGHITREGSCAYVSQQAWIVNATLRQNVLFGEQFNAKRYYQALTVCNLKEDLNMLPGGDETEIGERGINLSGGQKQRIALARALYANRDIYFLDDPLSAVDAQVGSYIFENLILRALQGKTVLFVTHQVQFLKHCRQVYMMHGGKIVEYGTHAELMQTSKDYASMVNSTILEKDNISSTSKKSATGSVGMRSVAVQNGEDVKRMRGGGIGTHSLTVEEKSEVGQVKGHTYNAYIKAAGGYLVTTLVIFIFFLSVGSSAFSSWWLAVWIKAGGGNVTNPVTNETVYSENLNENPDFGYYQTVYAACIGAILTMSLIRGFAITLTTINASTNLHNKVFKKMLSTSIKFFETTPSGRIQNIFSRDMDEVDNYLPISIDNMIQNIFTCSFAIIFVCAVLPWYSIPLIFLGASFFLISKLFRIAMRDFKRLESVSRAPVLSFITTTIQGLSTIHAFKKEKEFLDKFEELFDLNNLCLYLCQSGMRWSAVRLDSLAIASTCITAFLVIFLRGQISPALAGLAMAYCSQMSGVFQYTVRLMAETEVRFISVERINYYLKILEQEGNNEKPTIKPQADWPVAGKIEFQKVQMKYRKDLPVVLIDITFVAQSGEKIGIVGRTGSGKSSLITALFRLVEISSGKIKIDNIDTSKISLDLLRSKLSIIPQDPALFSGSIRSNLDPFSEHSDADIWEALEKTQLKGRVQKLEESVGFGGSKLSVGEKQLLCLARALLRNSKILVLDEATASVDPETEAVVNSTIKNEFAHCTILTIAHRLSTVLSCDRILVMSNGRIVESGPPDALRNNPATEFSKMMAAAEDYLSEAIN